MATPVQAEQGFVFPREEAALYIREGLKLGEDVAASGALQYEQIARNLASLDGQTVTVIDKEMRPEIHDSAMMGILRPPYRGFTRQYTTFETDGYIDCEDLDEPDFVKRPGAIYSPYFQIPFHHAFREWSRAKLAELETTGSPLIDIIPASSVVQTPSIVLLGNNQLKKYLAEHKYSLRSVATLRQMASELGVELPKRRTKARA